MGRSCHPRRAGETDATQEPASRILDDVAERRCGALPAHACSWTAEALGSRMVEVIQSTDSIPIEQIAAYPPHLIVATTLFDFDQVRAQLEGIATVVGPTTTADKCRRAAHSVARESAGRRMNEGHLE